MNVRRNVVPIKLPNSGKSWFLVLEPNALKALLSLHKETDLDIYDSNGFYNKDSSYNDQIPKQTLPFSFDSLIVISHDVLGVNWKSI